MDPEQFAENRRRLARHARQKKRRRSPQSGRVGLPCDWRPEEVINPEDNQPFTEAAAWEFVAAMLDDISNLQGQEVKVITLDRPQGQTAYQVTCTLPSGVLYVKVHDGQGQTIVGRSFHYSEHRT